MTKEQAIKIRSCFANGVEFKKLYTEETNILADELNSAIKKQIPQKPLYKQGTKYKWIDSVREHGRYHSVEKYSNRDACPNCKKDVLKTPYCEYCGQKLDWSSEE